MGEHATGRQIGALGGADPMDTSYEDDDDDDMPTVSAAKQTATKQHPREQPHSIGTTPRYGEERSSNDFSATLISPPSEAPPLRQPPPQPQPPRAQQPQPQQQQALAPLTAQTSVVGPSRPGVQPRKAPAPAVRSEAGLGFPLGRSNEILTQVVKGKRAAEDRSLGASEKRANTRATTGDGVAVVVGTNASAQAQAARLGATEDDPLLTQARDLYQHKDQRVNEIGKLILTDAALQLVFGYWLREKPEDGTEAALSKLLEGAQLFAKQHQDIHKLFNKRERAQLQEAWNEQMRLIQAAGAAMSE